MREEVGSRLIPDVTYVSMKYAVRLSLMPLPCSSAAGRSERMILFATLLENSWKFLISVGSLRRASKVGENKIDYGSRIVTMEFDSKRFWKLTTALGRKLSDGRLVLQNYF